MTALISTAYIPPIGYMVAIARHRSVLIEAKETFPKQTYRNRAVIMTAGGLRDLSVPTLRHNHSRTDEVAIDYRTRWATTHIRTIAAAYNASPYYMYYRDELECLIAQPTTSLLDYNTTLLRWLCRQLKIDCELSYTTDWRPIGSTEEDYRYAFSPKGEQQQTACEPYYQVFADRQPFAPNLSVIDLLMNLGPEAKDYIKRQA